MRVGDHILTGIKAKGFISRLIKFGAWVGRYVKDARRFSHSAIVYKVLLDGTVWLCEAVKGGVEFRKFHYAEGDYVVIPMYMGPEEQLICQEFCERQVKAGTKYGFLTFAACGINCILAHLHWLPISFSVARTQICSGLTAEMLIRSVGYYFEKDDDVIMPADIWVEMGWRVEPSFMGGR